MRIAVLFDGGGLARLGLERAGHVCVGYELDPERAYLGKFVGEGNVVCGDATKVNLRAFDAVWASPSCKTRSVANRGHGERVVVSSYLKADHLSWCLARPHDVVWVENVACGIDGWGVKYNATQFITPPRQNRVRIIGGRHEAPATHRPFQRTMKGVMPTVMAWEHKYCPGAKTKWGNARYAGRFFGRTMTLDEVAWAQGFEIPDMWYGCPAGTTSFKWKETLYQTLGEGVPVYMAEAFGKVY